MISETILEFKGAIYDCAKAFRKDANSIMTKLASEFNFKLQPSISFPKSIYKHHNNKVIFKDEWSFYFHGSHCRFEHLNTGQVLEVLFTHSPEFGYINPYFFFIYIKTTEKHKWLEEAVGEDNIYAAIEIMTDEGLLTKICDSPYNNLILAI